MRNLHDLVENAMAQGEFCSVTRAYAWNDSVLLLAYVDIDGSDYERVLRDADQLKRKIDAVENSFAAAVKGQAFPPPTNANATRDSRFVFIEPSSYAFANCLRIPKHFKQHSRLHDWYIDGRIVEHIDTLPDRVDDAMVNLLPAGKERLVYAYDGYLWTDGLF